MPTQGHSLEDETSYAGVWGSFVDGQAWLDGYALSDELIAAQNDRDFSGGTTGHWSFDAGGGTGTFTYDGVNPGGEKVGKLSSTGDDAWMSAILNVDDWAPGTVDGDYVCLSVDVYVPTANTSKTVNVAFSGNGHQEASVPGNQWTNVIVMGQRGAGCLLQIGHWAGDAANGDIIYFDNISFKKINASVSTNSALSNGNLIIAVDGSGNRAFGYIKKLQYTDVTRGADLLTNGSFTNWTGDDPDNWTVSTENGSNYVTEVAGTCRMVADTAMSISQAVLTTGKLYWYRITCTAAASGSIKLTTGGTLGRTISTVGVHYGYAVADGTSFQISGTSCDITFDDVAIREVTSPETSGAQIFKEKSLATQGWANVSTGFEYNNIYYFDVYNYQLGTKRKIIGNLGYY